MQISDAKTVNKLNARYGGGLHDYGERVRIDNAQSDYVGTISNYFSSKQIVYMEYKASRSGCMGLVTKNVVESELDTIFKIEGQLLSTDVG